MAQAFAKDRPELRSGGSSRGSDGQASISSKESLDAMRQRRGVAEPSPAGVALIEDELGFAQRRPCRICSLPYRTTLPADYFEEHPAADRCETCEGKNVPAPRAACASCGVRGGHRAGCVEVHDPTGQHRMAKPNETARGQDAIASPNLGKPPNAIAADQKTGRVCAACQSPILQGQTVHFDLDRPGLLWHPRCYQEAAPDG